MAEKTQTSNIDGGKTPSSWDSPPDAREKGSEYPNYWVRKTRSGHTFMLDDTKNNEHVTLQHRSGTMIQLMPDGGFQIVSHNQCILVGRTLLVGEQEKKSPYLLLDLALSDR